MLSVRETYEPILLPENSGKPQKESKVAADQGPHIVDGSHLTETEVWKLRPSPLTWGYRSQL